MGEVLPHTPWKNIVIEVPLKIGDSIHLTVCEVRAGTNWPVTLRDLTLRAGS